MTGRRGFVAGLAWSPCSLGVCWQLSLDKELLDFGSYVVGETASRVITLTNVGALGTTFKFLLASEACDVDASQLALKDVSVGHFARQGRGRPRTRSQE